MSELREEDSILNGQYIQLLKDGFKSKSKSFLCEGIELKINKNLHGVLVPDFLPGYKTFKENEERIKKALSENKVKLCEN
jgi:hypothetical protein